MFALLYLKDYKIIKKVKILIKQLITNYSIKNLLYILSYFCIIKFNENFK